MRLCAAVDGFRARHKSWPSRIIIGELEYENLKEVFLAETFSLIEQKLQFVEKKSSRWRLKINRGDDTIMPKKDSAVRGQISARVTGWVSNRTAL